MRRVRCLLPLGVVALSGLLLFGIRPVEAGIVYTAPIEDVVPHASHIVRVDWPATDGASFRVTKSLRGKLQPGARIVIRNLPPCVSRLLPAEADLHSGWSRERTKVVGAYMALYELDGRMYLVGRRPGHGVTAHSSVWLVGADERIFGFQQLINPGSPMPYALREPARKGVATEAPPFRPASFERHLAGLQERHPGAGPSLRPVPPAHATAFLEMIDPAIDWYGRRTHDYDLPPQARIALAKKIAAYAETAPKAMAVHAFDAIGMLASTHGRIQAHERTCLDLLVALVRTHGMAPFRSLLLHELKEGPYILTNREVLLAVARRTDKAVYDQGVRILVDLGTRVHHNEGVAAYWALKANGEHGAAASVRIAQRAEDDQRMQDPPTGR